MKKINIIYLAIIPVLFGIYYISENYAGRTVMFYGFAENKDTEINHDHPVQVNKILVAPGQFVKQGDLLLEVTHSKFDLEITDLTHDIEAMRLQAQRRRDEINRSIQQLESDRRAKVSDFELRMQRLQSDADLNRSLLKDLKSIEIEKNTNGKSPNDLKMEALRQEMETATKGIDLVIQQLKEELATVNAPQEVQMKKLESEKDFYQEEQKKLAIRAPKDGLIGNIHCLEGEHKSSFSTLITFYEKNPTQVRGYVHESLIVHVKEGDTLEVSSILHQEQKGFGIVVGLGSRIVEIPERLRKIPEIKTYGREVLIQIPPDNPFLQKEKVVLNFLNPEEIRPTKLPAFLKTSHSANSETKGAASQQ